MSLSTTLLLGFIAGGTIVLGLPLGRLRRPMPSLRVFLNAAAVGVLMFLFWDVLSAAWEPIDEALGAWHDNSGGLGPAFGYGALFVGGLAVGLLGLVGYDRYLARRAARPAKQVGGQPVAGELVEETIDEEADAWTAATRLSFLIAVGIGLHNFAEGLAIGQAAGGGAISLATVLVIGFALHNATEGFGIVAPLAAESRRMPSWGFLLLMGLIGGGPTFLGTAVGYQFTSEAVSVIFLTLAAGSITYVIVQLLGTASRARRMDLVSLGILAGVVAGFLTDAIVTAGGV